MIVRSWVGVSCFATSVSAGTSGETPPRPWSPWHCEQAKPTKSWAPAATCGSIEPRSRDGRVRRVPRRMADGPAGERRREGEADARMTIAASAVAGFQELDAIDGLRPRAAPPSGISRKFSSALLRLLPLVQRLRLPRRLRRLERLLRLVSSSHCAAASSARGRRPLALAHLLDARLLGGCFTVGLEIPRRRDPQPRLDVRLDALAAFPAARRPRGSARASSRCSASSSTGSASSSR